MTDKEIELIAKNEKYINYCRKISDYDSVLSKDLHQEFCVAVLLQKERIKEIPQDERDLYFYGMVWQLWNNPKRARNTYKLEKDVFYSLKDNKHNLNGYFENKKAHQPTREEIELKAQVSQELNLLLESNNEQVRKGAEYLRIFIEGKNRLQISKELGVNYRIVHESIENTLNIIRAKITGKIYMTKTEIKLTLQGEGVKASYSGKDKTFYVDKLPASGIIKEVEQAGFKVKKNG